MSDYEVVDEGEAVQVHLKPRRKAGPSLETRDMMDLLRDKRTLFLRGKTPNTITTLRYWIGKTEGRRLDSRSGERNGVSGVYVWIGPLLKR